MTHGKKPTFGYWAVVTAVTFVAVPVLYLGSSGPLYLLVAYGAIGEGVVDWFYKPLDFFAPYLPDWVIDRFLDYVKWWVDWANPAA